VRTLPHTSWPPRPPVEDVGPNGAPMELRCYLPAESRRRRRAPISMPVLVLAVLAVAVLLWQLVYRIAA